MVSQPIWLISDATAAPPRGIAAADHQPGAAARGEQPGDGLAKPLGAAGDDGVLAGELA